MDGSIAGHTMPNRHEESGYRNPMGGNGHWASRFPGYRLGLTSFAMALEDKIVQHAVVEVLNQIWEEDFQDFSYGFRPGRSQHDALDALYTGITQRQVNYVLDLDIRSFLDPASYCPLVTEKVRLLFHDSDSQALTSSLSN